MKIIIDIPGGFGNQLFGYAFGYALTRELGCEYYIHTPFQDNGITWELQLNKLKLQYDGQLTYPWTQLFIDRAVGNKFRRRVAIGWATRISKENPEWSLEDYVRATQKDTMYYGNWENQRFFVKYRDDLLKMLVPKEPNGGKALVYCQSVNMKNSVGVHVRRGDKVAIGGSLAKDYYIQAILQMRKMLGEDTQFFIISDDIPWCKENIVLEGIDFQYPAETYGNSTFDDWIILKNCRHHIIADSTFSWWAAWLSENPGHIVICPKQMRYQLDNWLVV